MLDPRTEFAKLRERAGLSVEETAKLLRVTERSVRRYETMGPRGSEPAPLAMDFMFRMAEAGVPKLPVARTETRFRFQNGNRFRFRFLFPKSKYWSLVNQETERHSVSFNQESVCGQ